MRPKILLVEDEYALQTTIKEYLEPTYHVITARTAKQALDSLRDTHFKVLLVDLGLPDANGLSIIKLAVKDHPGTAVLALTGDKSSDSVQKAIQAGVEDYLVKPVGASQLLDRIEKAALKRTISSRNH